MKNHNDIEEKYDECPYCEKSLEYGDINHDDGYGYEEDQNYEQECPHCGKIFAYRTIVSFDYHTNKAPCLNEESDHVWKDFTTYPDDMYLVNKYCIYCGFEERKPDPDFWKRREEKKKIEESK